MIVKNEEALLARCLDSVRRVVDQIVIVDTGSEDETLRIAERYGAEIHHYKWRDDFSAARNRSLQYAKGDWILWMDADEYLLPDSVPKLKRLLVAESRPVIYKIQIQNLQSDQKAVSLSDAHRLFTNWKGIRFSGRIHEQIYPSAKAVGAAERESEVYLYHLGYSYTGEKAARKNRRNKKLLERMVREEPRNAYAQYTLGQHYGLNRQHDKAIHHYKIAYHLHQLPKAMTASLLNVLAQEHFRKGLLPEAKKYGQKSLELVKQQAGGYYLLYEIAKRENRMVEAVEWLQELLRMTRKIRATRKHLSTDVLIDEDKILYTIAESYHRQRQFKQALEYYERVLQTGRSDTALLKRLLDVAATCGDSEKIESYLSYFNSASSEDIRFLIQIGRILIGKELYNPAIRVYQRVIALEPENIIGFKRLIGLYAKTGHSRKAAELALKAQDYL